MNLENELESNETLDRLTRALESYVSKNRGPDGPTTYAVRATGYSADEGAIEFSLTFLAGRRYCCCEPGCHLGLFRLERWRALRQYLREHDIEPRADPLTVRLLGIVEKGVVLTALPGLADRTTSESTYREVFDEARAEARP